MATETVYITPQHDLSTGTTDVREITWDTDRQRKFALCAALAAAIGKGGPFELNVGASTEGRDTFTAYRAGRVAATVIVTPAQPAPTALATAQDTAAEITAEGLPIGDPNN